MKKLHSESFKNITRFILNRDNVRFFGEKCGKMRGYCLELKGERKHFTCTV